MRDPHIERYAAMSTLTVEEAAAKAIGDMSAAHARALKSILDLQGRDMREHFEQQILRARERAQRDMSDAFVYTTRSNGGSDDWWPIGVEKSFFDRIYEVGVDEAKPAGKEIIVEYVPGEVVIDKPEPKQLTA